MGGPRPTLWAARLQDLRAFVAEHGHMPRFNTQEEPEHGLCLWISGQRTAARRGTLLSERRVALDRWLPGWLPEAAREAATDARTQALDALVPGAPLAGQRATIDAALAAYATREEIADAAGTTPHTVNHFVRGFDSGVFGAQVPWGESWEQAKVWRERIGQWPRIKATDTTERRLAWWISTQRARWRRGELEPDRVQTLTDDGFIFEPPVGGRGGLDLPLTPTREESPAASEAPLRRTEALRLLREGASDHEVERQTGMPHKVVAVLRRNASIPAWSASTPEHGTTARARRGCDCAPCREAKAVQAAEEYARSGRTTTRGPLPADRVVELDERRRESLTRTAQAATRRGRWTEDERAIALDMTLSAEQAAIRLGRTRSAVEHQRAKHPDQRTADGPLPRGRRARA